jgi:hypothetical protein
VSVVVVPACSQSTRTGRPKLLLPPAPATDRRRGPFAVPGLDGRPLAADFHARRHTRGVLAEQVGERVTAPPHATGGGPWVTIPDRLSASVCLALGKMWAQSGYPIHGRTAGAPRVRDEEP